MRYLFDCVIEYERLHHGKRLIFLSLYCVIGACQNRKKTVIKF